MTFQKANNQIKLVTDLDVVHRITKRDLTGFGGLMLATGATDENHRAENKYSFHRAGFVLHFTRKIEKVNKPKTVSYCILTTMEIRDIEKLAKLARIELTDAEKVAFAHDLDSILGYVDQIREVATDDKPAEVGGIFNVLREDEVQPDHETGQFTEKILAEAPAVQDGFVKVKKIL